MKRVTLSTGEILSIYSGYIDEHGNDVERTKFSHPYSYDGYIVWRGGENTEATNDVYSDRMFQWDSDKYNKLTLKHFKNQSQYWNDRKPEEIEAFLRDYVGDQELKLIFVMEYCHQMSGYPMWRFAYHSKVELKS